MRPLDYFKEPKKAPDGHSYCDAGYTLVIAISWSGSKDTKEQCEITGGIVNVPNFGTNDMLPEWLPAIPSYGSD